MCKQAVACILCIAGLILLLLCFMPTWLICFCGVALIIAGAAFVVIKLKQGK